MILCLSFLFCAEEFLIHCFDDLHLQEKAIETRDRWSRCALMQCTVLIHTSGELFCPVNQDLFNKAA